METKLIGLAFSIAVLTASAAAQTSVTNSDNSTTNTVPVYTGSAILGNSPIAVSGSNVGIGTTTPSAPLNIAGTSMQIYDPSQPSANYSYIKTTATTFNTETLTLGTTYGFYTPVDTLSIFDGMVGIGTTAPGAPLEVNG